MSLIAVQECLEGERPKAIEGHTLLDLAVDALYEHTNFRQVSHKLFRAAVAGQLSIDQEALLRELGVI